MQRRQFVKSAVASAGALASGLGASRSGIAEEAEQVQHPAKIGRLVRAVSIAFTPGLPLDRIAGLVDREGTAGVDLIALPETCRGQNEKSRKPWMAPRFQRWQPSRASIERTLFVPLTGETATFALTRRCSLTGAARWPASMTSSIRYGKRNAFPSHRLGRGTPRAIFNRLRQSWPGNLLRYQLDIALGADGQSWSRVSGLAQRLLGRAIAAGPGHPI